MPFIEKRTGEIVPFEEQKIYQAIEKAKAAIEQMEEVDAKKVTEMVLSSLSIWSDRSIISVEEIQDAVEKALMECGHHETAKAYILYREQHRKIREERETLVNVENTMTEYLNKSDWRVKRIPIRATLSEA